MYVGKNSFKKLVQMLPFFNMLVCFISIKCYDFFQSSSLRYTNFKLKHGVSVLFLHLNMKYFARSKIKLIETDLSFPFTFGYESLQNFSYI